MKPTPEEKCHCSDCKPFCQCNECYPDLSSPSPQARCKHQWAETPYGHLCSKCAMPYGCKKHLLENPSPSPEAMEPLKPEYAKILNDHFWEIVDMPNLKPSPEARVDWENKAREIVKIVHDYPREYEDEALKRIAKALSAAFEKGREAR